MTSIPAYYVLIVANLDGAATRGADRHAGPTLVQRLRAFASGLRPVRPQVRHA